MKRIWLLLLTLVLAVGLITACGNQGSEDQSKLDQGQVEQSQGSTNQGSENQSKEDQGSFPITIIDDLGIEVTISKKPERIVSLIPSNTEILYALGLGDQVVGVSDYCNYPAEAAEKEKLGGLEFNVEKILSLNPDLVLAHGSNKGKAEEGYNQLRNAGVNVIVVPSANSISQVFETIQMIANVTGTEARGQEVINEMQEKIDHMVEQVQAVPEEKRVKVWVEVSPELYTAGKGTFMNEMIELLNGTNVVGESDGWFQLSEEDAVNLNPDVIITTYGYYVDNSEEEVLGRPAWQDVEAVKNKRVYDVDSDMVTRAGPRLAEGIEEFAKAIYPDIFAK